MKISIPASALVILCSFSQVFAQSDFLPEYAQKIIDAKFRSWRLADIDKEIVDYYKRERAHEHPNSVKGDWNGDGKVDYAVQLQNRQNGEKKIIVVLVKSGNSFDRYILEAADCIMSEKKGNKAYDFETKKSFRYKNDAIFSCYWEKAGTSYVWRNGRFLGIVTSD